jgi:Zn-dependent protease with chaperone function
MTHVTAAMCIEDPLQYHSGFFHKLFMTHPPIQERIAALQRMLEVQQT